MRHSARLVTGLVVVTVVIAAALVSVAVASTGTNPSEHPRLQSHSVRAPSHRKLPPGYTNNASAHNRAAARAAAKHLLTLVKLPAGSRRLSAEPRGGHGYLAANPPAADTKVAAGWWTVPVTPVALIKYAERHRPQAGHRFMTGGGENYKTGTSSVMVGFQWPLEKYRLGSRTLDITATKLTDGKTGVVVDAAAQWWVLRSVRERLPRTLRSVQIRVAGWHKRHTVNVTISAPGKVRQVVELVNSFPLASLGSSCTLEFPGPDVTIRLLNGAGRKIGAIGYMDAPSHLTVSRSSCNPVSFTLHGRQMRALIGGRFMWRLQQLAGRSLVGRTN